MGGMLWVNEWLCVDSTWWRKVLTWRLPTDTGTHAWWLPATRDTLQLFATCSTKELMSGERAWKVKQTWHYFGHANFVQEFRMILGIRILHAIDYLPAAAEPGYWVQYRVLWADALDHIFAVSVFPLARVCFVSSHVVRYINKKGQGNIPLTFTWPDLRCDVGLEEGEYLKKDCLYVIVLRSIIMMHNGTSSSYRSVDCGTSSSYRSVDSHMYCDRVGDINMS